MSDWVYREATPRTPYVCYAFPNGDVRCKSCGEWDVKCNQRTCRKCNQPINGKKRRADYGVPPR